MKFNYPRRRKPSKQSGIEHQQRVSVCAHVKTILHFLGLKANNEGQLDLWAKLRASDRKQISGMNTVPSAPGAGQRLPVCSTCLALEKTEMGCGKNSPSTRMSPQGAGGQALVQSFASWVMRRRLAGAGSPLLETKVNTGLQISGEALCVEMPTGCWHVGHDSQRH